MLGLNLPSITVFSMIKTLYHNSKVFSTRLCPLALPANWKGKGKDKLKKGEKERGRKGRGEAKKKGRTGRVQKGRRGERRGKEKEKKRKETERGEERGVKYPNRRKYVEQNPSLPVPSLSTQDPAH